MVSLSWFRRFAPQGTDLSLLSRQQVRAIQDTLNDWPVECLGWRRPSDVYRCYAEKKVHLVVQ